MEIEAKYTVSDPAIFDTLHELRGLGDYALRPTRDRDLIDHYLDTPNRDLLRGGYACRLREGEADRHWVLTVKGLGRADGAVHQREEHECQVPPHTAPAEWPESPAREIVTRLSAGRPLAELVTLRQHRVCRAVEHGERAVGELSLDTVEADLAGRKTLNQEIEIELSASGTVDDLHAIGAALRPFGLKPQSTSKFERALAMLDETGKAPAPKKKKAPDVRADEPLAEAGRKILRFHFERMVANEAGTRTGEDIEALHHMRVATRRQRAAVRIVAPYFKRKAFSGFRDDLRTLAERLGAVRDLDVLIEDAERYRAPLGADAAAALEPLAEEWRAQRDGARDELLRYLDGDDYRAFIERYGEFLATTGAGVKDAPDGSPLPHLVCHVLPMEIWDHYGRVRAYETVMEWASIDTIHSLRIEGKRLRYLLEFFGEALGPGLSGVIEALVGLQDHIGELHDVDVTIGLLRDFLMRSPQASADPAVAAAAGRYLKLKEARLRTLQRTLKRPWRRVAAKRLRAALARAVARL
jgi:CHAD domain-containing protein